VILTPSSHRPIHFQRWRDFSGGNQLDLRQLQKFAVVPELAYWFFMEQLLGSGVKAVTLLAISDQGKPSFNHSLAKKLTDLGMPCFGCSPDRLPDLLTAVLKGQDLKRFASQAEVSNPGT
jgi:hypothetical protein